MITIWVLLELTFNLIGFESVKSWSGLFASFSKDRISLEYIKETNLTVGWFNSNKLNKIIWLLTIMSYFLLILRIWEFLIKKIYWHLSYMYIANLTKSWWTFSLGYLTNEIISSKLSVEIKRSFLRFCAFCTY